MIEASKTDSAKLQTVGVIMPGTNPWSHSNRCGLRPQGWRHPRRKLLVQRLQQLVAAAAAARGWQQPEPERPPAQGWQLQMLLVRLQ